jgi:hypothetical protein
VGFIFGLGFQCQPHHFGDFLISDGSRSATAGQVKNSLEARVIKALAQLANRRLTKTDFPRNLLIVQALSKEQNRLGATSLAFEAFWGGGSAWSELVAREL